MFTNIFSERSVLAPAYLSFGSCSAQLLGIWWLVFEAREFIIKTVCTLSLNSPSPPSKCAEPVDTSRVVLLVWRVCYLPLHWIICEESFLYLLVSSHSYLSTRYPKLPLFARNSSERLVKEGPSILADKGDDQRACADITKKITMMMTDSWQNLSPFWKCSTGPKNKKQNQILLMDHSEGMLMAYMLEKVL